MKVIILILFSIFFSYCHSKRVDINSTKKANVVSKMKWDVKTIDFGKVGQDTIIKGYFAYKYTKPEKRIF